MLYLKLEDGQRIPVEPFDPEKHSGDVKFVPVAHLPILTRLEPSQDQLLSLAERLALAGVYPLRHSWQMV